MKKKMMIKTTVPSSARHRQVLERFAAYPVRPHQPINPGEDSSLVVRQAVNPSASQSTIISEIASMHELLFQMDVRKNIETIVLSGDAPQKFGVSVQRGLAVQWHTHATA
jgi:hypothetical protein